MSKSFRGLGRFAALALLSATASANPISYDLFYTTFNGGPNINRVHVTYTGDGTAGNGVFSLTGDVNIASTPGADGIVLNPNNNRLLIGGQGNAIHEVNPATGTFISVTPGVGAFHLAVDPSKDFVWASGIPGALSSMPINPSLSEPETILPLSGDDTAVTSLAFTPGNGAFYTASGAGGFGSFGAINLATGVTTRFLSSVPAAHGMQFDPFTGDLILVGDGHITQIDPVTHTIVSDRSVGGVNFDQGAVDGLGHMFIASNTGHLLFMDYSNTGLVADVNNFTALPFLRDALDDVAPLIGGGGTGCGLPGQPPCGTPEPGSLALLTISLAGIGLISRRRKDACH